MRYSHRIGIYEPYKPSILEKVTLLVLGCAIGLFSALCVIYNQIQHAPVHIEMEQR